MFTSSESVKAMTKFLIGMNQPNVHNDAPVPGDTMWPKCDVCMANKQMTGNDSNEDQSKAHCELKISSAGTTACSYNTSNLYGVEKV